MKGYIYKLFNPNCDKFYIGSTIDFDKRVNYHKRDATEENRPLYKSFKYQYIRENGGIENWTFEILETREFEDRRELRLLEQFHMDIQKPTLNIIRSLKM